MEGRKGKEGRTSFTYKGTILTWDDVAPPICCQEWWAFWATVVFRPFGSCQIGATGHAMRWLLGRSVFGQRWLYFLDFCVKDTEQLDSSHISQAWGFLATATYTQRTFRLLRAWPCSAADCSLYISKRTAIRFLFLFLVRYNEIYIFLDSSQLFAWTLEPKGAVNSFCNFATLDFFFSLSSRWRCSPELFLTHSGVESKVPIGQSRQCAGRIVLRPEMDLWWPSTGKETQMNIGILQPRCERN